MARILKHPVPDMLLARIGDVTVSFALLESVVQTLAHSLVGAGQRMGQAITAELSFRNLRALVASLSKERVLSDADLEELRGLLKRSQELEDVRNQITHSVWGAGNTKASITRIKTTAKEKHGLRFVFEDVSEERLQEVCTDLKALSSDFQVFWIRLVEEGKASNG